MRGLSQTSCEHKLLQRSLVNDLVKCVWETELLGPEWWKSKSFQLWAFEAVVIHHMFIKSDHVLWIFVYLLQKESNQAKKRKICRARVFLICFSIKKVFFKSCITASEKSVIPGRLHKRLSRTPQTEAAMIDSTVSNTTAALMPRQEQARKLTS